MEGPLEFQPDVLGLLDIFLKFSYYVLLVPFRLQKQGGKYKLHCNRFQKVACFVLLLFVSGKGFLMLRYEISRGLMKNPEETFAVLSNILSACTGLVWIYCWIVDKGRCVQLLQFQDYNPPPLKIRLGLIFITSVITLQILRTLCEPLTWRSSTETIKYFAGSGFYELHMSDDYYEDYPELSTGTAVFGSIYFILGVWRYLFFHLTMLLPITSAMMIYQATNRFIVSVQLQRNDFGLRQVLERYESYLGLIEIINSISGPTVVLFTLELIPTCIWMLFNTFGGIDEATTTWEYIILIIIRSSLYTIQLILSAESHAKIGHFNRWLMTQKMAEFQNVICKDVETQNENYFNTLRLQEMTRISVGVSGSEFFTISYGFIGALMSLIGTYAVVMLQFQVAKYQTGFNDGNCTMELFNSTADEGEKIVKSC